LCDVRVCSPKLTTKTQTKGFESTDEHRCTRIGAIADSKQFLGTFGIVGSLRLTIECKQAGGTSKRSGASAGGFGRIKGRDGGFDGIEDFEDGEKARDLQDFFRVRAEICELDLRAAAVRGSVERNQGAEAAAVDARDAAHVEDNFFALFEWRADASAERSGDFAEKNRTLKVNDLNAGNRLG